MKLVELYSLASGLKIGKQYLREDFYPLPFTRYITLHASSGMAGKNYPYYVDVVNFIKPFLVKLGIEIVQIGGKDDAPVPGTYFIGGKYNFNQGAYVLKNALLHLGNDSCWGHRAGHIGVPLVQPFGPTDFRNHASYDFDPTKTIFLESHRWGRKPTFASQESPSSMALIPPEELANAVLQLLKVEERILEKTVFMGGAYTTNILEWIPNMPIDPNFNPNAPFTARMDLEHNEEMLLQVLSSGRKINIVTKKPINPNLLNAFKANILSYNHEIFEDCPLPYVRIIRPMIQRTTFFSRLTDTEALAKLRFTFFDVCNIEHAIDRTKQDFINEAATYLNKPFEKALDIGDNFGILSFKTNKYVLSKGKIYPSNAHAAVDLPISLGNEVAKVIDNEVFWKETQHQRIFIT